MKINGLRMITAQDSDRDEPGGIIEVHSFRTLVRVAAPELP